MDGQYNILIVDDNPSNLYLLDEYVLKFGFRSITVNGGRAALDTIAREKIDAILLDIMMPGMNGWLVLDTIKKNPKTAGIPVIMVSALDDVKNIASCLEAGADDYISKPFSPEILKARLSNCLERKTLNAEIEKSNAQLESKVAEKTRELADAYEKLKKLDEAKADFIKIIVHELRTPLTGIQASAELLFEESGKENKELIKAFRDSYERMNKLVEQAILISKLDLYEDIELQEYELKDIIISGLDESKLATVGIKTILPENVKGRCRCNLSLMTCAFREIFDFCAKLCPNESDFKIMSGEPGTLEILIKNIKMPQWQDISGFFKTTTKNRAAGGKDVPGIEPGPLIASKILNIFLGSISSSAHEKGTLLTIKVPVI